MFELQHLIGFGAFTPPAVSTGPYVASVQHVEVTIAASATTGTATITSVDTARSVAFFSGHTTSSTGSQIQINYARAELTNATTVTAVRNVSSTNTVVVRVCVVEFTSALVSSVQTGTIAIATPSTSNTATITSVDTSRSIVVYQGATTNLLATAVLDFSTAVTLTNATTVTAQRGGTNGDVTTGFTVIEFASGTVQSLQQRAATFTDTSTTNADTITSVNTARTVLFWGGISTSTSGNSSVLMRAELTSGTNVNVVRAGANSGSRSTMYTAVEFVSGIINTMQRGTLTLNSVTSNTATITSIDTSKTFLSYVGMSSAAANNGERWARVGLTNGTTVTANKGIAGASTSVVAWEAAEFN